MRPGRIAKLERLVFARPCPGCGRPFDAPGAHAEPSPPGRLSAAEGRELDGILGAAEAPACARCGRTNHEFARLTAAQLDRAIELLGALTGLPDLGRFDPPLTPSEAPT